MLNTTRYYDEFLRYASMAKEQQALCNLGTSPYEGSVPDDLMCKVTLYDVVERKYAGFSQIINDCFYGWTMDHPYWSKMVSGDVTQERLLVAKRWTGTRDVFDLADWLYLFILHRVTGSAINYAKQPSGYHNTIIPDLYECDDIEDMVDVVKSYSKTFYTSVGYQFPKFPWKEGYKRGGDRFLVEYAPRLARDLADKLKRGASTHHLTLRDVGEFMFEWNRLNGLNAYRFQYAAVIADIADWFPDLVERDSPFYYGTNARECLNYLAVKPSGITEDQHLDLIVEMIQKDTGMVPYNSEDVACDFIRWVENYVRPGAAYDHLDRDKVWSSCRIYDHPFGRQRAMLELGLLQSFNDLSVHPSDDYVIRQKNMTPAEYKNLVAMYCDYPPNGDAR
jgi:hypothetical protein